PRLRNESKCHQYRKEEDAFVSLSYRSNDEIRMTNGERMTKVKWPKFSLPNAHHFRFRHFWLVSAFDIPGSPLAFEIFLLRYLLRNSSKAYEPNDSKGVNLPILSLNPVPLQGACVSREGIRVDGSPYNPISSRTYFTAGLP